MEVMKSVLLSTDGKIPTMEQVAFPKNAHLDFYYEQIECDCIDIVHAYALEELGIKGSVGEFCLVIDDEGLMKDIPVFNPIASLLYGIEKHCQPLYGKVLVCQNRDTPDGIETVGLNDYDIAVLEGSIAFLIREHNARVDREQNK